MATTVTGYHHTIAQQYRTQAGSVAEVTDTIDGDSEINVDESVPAGATNFEIDVAVTDTAVQSLALWAGSSVTVKTNTTSGVDVFALTTQHPVLWNIHSAIANPLTAPVTKLYVDNAGLTPARVRFSALVIAHPLA